MFEEILFMTDSNHLLIQTSLSIAHLNVLTDMVLGVYKETLSKEDYENVHQNFYNRLKDEQIKALRNIKDIVTDQALLLRQEFDVIEGIEFLKSI